MAGTRARTRRAGDVNGVRLRGAALARNGGRLVAHEQIVDVQRARILSAMVQESCKRGAGDVSVAQVVERSGVSRRTFYETFHDREDCFLAAFEQVHDLVRECVVTAVQAHRGWRDQVRAGLIAVLTFIDEQPQLGRMLIRESLSGSNPRVLERREQIVAEMERAVDGGHRQACTSSTATYLTSEGIVGAVLAILYSRLSLREPGRILDLTNELMSMIVLPYLGNAAAQKELSQPVPAASKASERSSAALPFDPFKARGMRLTYRTVRALLAIAEHPHSSNRRIGEAAGMRDQGQVSKLLARLERLGLIVNAVSGTEKGLANAWGLTEQGRALTESLSAHGFEVKERIVS